MKKIKVLHIIKSLGRGGAEMLLAETLKVHNQDRFEFHYAYFLPWKDQLVEPLRKAGGTVTCISASNSLLMLLRVPGVIRYIKSHQIEIVHCHLPWAGIVGRVVHKLVGLPVLYTEHNKQERYHVLTRWANRISFNWETAVVAVSNAVAVSIRQNIRPRVPVHEVLNSVNVKLFQRDGAAALKLRSAWNVPPDALVVGTVAVFRSQKRLKEWLDVFADVHAGYPDLYGAIAGDGPLMEEIVQYRRKLGLEDRVILPGLQTDVMPWYSLMDIFMMTSEFEGLPLALLEAMSMECAVVTTDAGGVKEVIIPDCGLMVGVAEWRQLGSALKEIVNDPQKRLALARAARARVRSSFGMERMVVELERLYISYLGASHGNAASQADL